MRFRFLSALLVTTAAVGIAVPASAADKKAAKKTKKKAAKKITYDDHIRPIFSAKCRSCHNPDKKSGGLDITNFTNLMQGGSSGEVVEPGSSADSYLYMLVTHESTPFMPPKTDKLPAKTLKLIKDWIDGGALENSGSKFKKKKGVNLTLKNVSSGRPKGPPPMPPRLSLEPHVVTKSTTAISALATSPWAPLAAVAGQKQVLLYNTKTLGFLGALSFPEGEPKVLKFSRNGALLLAGGGRGGANGKVIVWDVRTAKRVFEVGDEIDSVLAADISADQSMIAMGGPQRIVRIYSTATGEVMHELRKHTEWIYSLEFSPDGVLLASGDRNGGMFVWEAFTGREYLSLRGHGSGITGISWRADSNILASCSEDTTVRLWEMENGRNVRRWGAHGGGVACLEFARDGRILTCGRDRRAKLWNQNGGLVKQFNPFSDLALRVTFCDETNRAIAGDWNGTIRVWNAQDAKIAGSLSPNPPLLAARIDIAKKALVAEKAKYTATQSALSKVQAAYNAHVKAEAAARSAMSKAQATIKANNGNIAAYQKDIAARRKQDPVLKKEAARLAGLVTPLVELAKKAKALADANKADKSLQTLNSQAAAAVKQKTSAAATAKTNAAKNAEQIKKQTAAIAAAQKSTKTAQAAQLAAKKRLPQLNKNVKAARIALAKSASANQQAKASYEKAAQAAGRWEAEAKFAAQVKRLSQKLESANSQLVAAQQQLGTAQQGVRKLRAELLTLNTKQSAVTKTLESAGKSKQQLSSKKDVAQKRINQLTGNLAKTGQSVTSLTKAIGLLKEAQAKAAEASKADAKNKQVAQSVTALNGLVTTMAKQLASQKSAQVSSEKQVNAQRAMLGEISKLLAKVETDLRKSQSEAQQLRKQMETIKSRQTQINEVVESAKKAVAAAKKLVDEASKELAAVRIPQKRTT